MNSDLIVVGGGTAGVMAALAAASRGIKVTIIEQQSTCGGNATLSGLAEFNAVTFKKRLIYNGFEKKIFDRLVEWNSGKYYYQLPMSSDKSIRVDRLRYNPEVLKLILEDLLTENNVRIYYNTSFRSAQKLTNGFEIEAESFGKSVQLSTKYIIDGTSNSAVAVSLGCQTQPLASNKIPVSTQLFRLSNVDLTTLQEFIDSGHLSEIINDAFAKDIIKGRILAFAPIPGTNDVSVNVTRTSVDYRDALQLSRGLQESRKQISSIIVFIKENIPGCENSYISNIAPILGVRASIKLKGRTTLSLSDIQQARQFEDCVAVGCYPVDVHDPITKKVHFMKINSMYQIPFSACLPQEDLNLAVIGKAISTDDETFAATRVMPIVMNVGESVGAIFAYAINAHKNIYDFSPSKFQQVLNQTNLVSNFSEVN